MAYGKRLRKVYTTLDRQKLYSLEEAVKILKTSGVAKFDQTVDISMNLNVDTSKSDQQVRGVVQLPNGTGKSVRVLVFAKPEKAAEAAKAGAEVVGGEELVEEVMNGRSDFDKCIATPDMMILVGKLGKVLGPRGLMPNPKLGTVAVDVAKAVQALKGGQVEYRAEKAGVVHAGVGKVSFSEKAIAENVKAFFDAVQRAKPAGAKGVYLRRVTLSSTMGPGLKLDVSGLQN